VTLNLVKDLPLITDFSVYLIIADVTDCIDTHVLGLPCIYKLTFVVLAYLLRSNGVITGSILSHVIKLMYNTQLEVVKLLVESGANVNHRDNLGVTALFWATGNILKYLSICIFVTNTFFL